MSIFNRHARTQLVGGHQHTGGGPFYPECPVCNPTTQRTPEWDEARSVCEKLGLDADNEYVDSLTIVDFVRLAYNLGQKATESRLYSRDMADVIALALQTPEAVVERDLGETQHRWTVRAVQQVVAFGVPT